MTPRHAEALAEFDAVLTARRQLHGEDHPNVPTTRHHRALAMAALGFHTHARAQLEEVLTLRRGLFGSDPPESAETETALLSLGGET